jgi:hypothetical protein
MAADGAVGAKYEMRRLARGVALLVALMAAMLGMARLGFLFPDTQEDKVLPPQKPPQAPLEKDRELFRVKSPRPGPWRVGTLDVYDGKSWLLPPYDPRRVKPMVNASGVQTYKAEFDLVDVRGHNLPVPANVLAVRGDAKPEYDPRTQVPRLPSRIPRHFRYTAEAVVPPNGKDMNASPPPNAKVAAEFGRIPAAPGEVLALLADAPTVPFDRMQFLRDRLYANVVAAGSGQPVDVTPARVAQMLQPNAEATPYEITAAEAMLARWAGVPSRIGFGFHGGDPLPDGTSSFRPRHGAAWMEAYFEGFGWVPLVGTPPRAKSSLTADQKNDDPRVKPTDDLAMVLYLPARRLTFKLLYEIVRYWVLVLLPFALLGLAVVVLAPWLTKQARRVRRRRWGAGRGPIGQTLAAYAELRDRCHDLNLGDVRSSPLEFVDSFAPDGEHDELGWLVTRVLWGDLRRDVRAEDAAACGEMCRSVWRRMVSEQTPVNRFLGAVSRASLRDPYSDDVPNLWVSWSLGRGLRKLGRQARRVGRSLTPRRLAEARGAAMLLVVVLLLTTLTGCVRQGGLTGATVAVRLPAVLPSQTLLGYGVQPEPAVEAKYRAKSKTKLLVDDGRVVTFHEGHITQGALQVALFKPEVDSQDPGIQRDVEKSIAGTFTTYRFGTVRVRLHESPQQRIFLWFPPDSNTMEVFVVRKQFADALRVVRAAIAQQRGLSPELLAGRTLLPVPPPAPDAPVPPSSPGSSPGSPGSASAFPAGAASGATP